MTKREAYWVGPGVLTIGSKTIKEGDPIHELLDEETIAKHVKKGKAAHTLRAASTADDSTAYKEQIEKLSADLSKVTGDLETITAERDELLAKSEQQDATIKGLTDQLTKAASAGPAQGKK